jgi:hypothetical protein
MRSGAAEVRELRFGLARFAALQIAKCQVHRCHPKIVDMKTLYVAVRKSRERCPLGLPGLPLLQRAKHKSIAVILNWPI